MMQIKICGMKYAENIYGVAELKPDYLGFIFHKQSPRYPENLLPEQVFNLSPGIEKVGVFVNEDLAEIKQICKNYQIKTVQLHGSESPGFCHELKNSGFKIIKAFGMDKNFDFMKLESFLNEVDFFLFDTKTTGYGGSGQHFDWALLEKYQLNIPFFLSGGISLGDLDEIKKIRSSKLFGIDVNSRFELEAGLKNIPLLKQLINSIKNEF